MANPRQTRPCWTLMRSTGRGRKKRHECRMARQRIWRETASQCGDVGERREQDPPETRESGSAASSAGAAPALAHIVPLRGRTSTPFSDTPARPSTLQSAQAAFRGHRSAAPTGQIWPKPGQTWSKSTLAGPRPAKCGGFRGRPGRVHQILPQFWPKSAPNPPKSSQIQSIPAKFGRVPPKLPKVGPHWALGRFRVRSSRKWPKAVRTRSTSAQIRSNLPDQSWPTCVEVFPHVATSTKCSPSSSSDLTKSEPYDQVWLDLAQNRPAFRDVVRPLFRKAN